MSPAVIAVDGGGTRCRLSLDGRVTVETGPANLVSDPHGALARLRAGLGDLADAAGLPAAALAEIPAYLGLAGCLSSGLGGRIAAELPCPVLAVEDDRPAAVRGALGSAMGGLAHCGTGSFLARRSAEGIRLAGGWGAILGDEASAAWTGRRALSRTLDAADGLTAPSGLTEGLMQRLGGSAGIVAFAAGAGPAALGSLAPEVTARAAEGDPVAAGILAEGAGHIARVLAALGHRPGDPLCLTGGIGPAFAPYLPDGLQAGLREPAGTPLDGALAIARELAGQQQGRRA
ncbi:BadF/BadG/BcrA/BcrD ATPase family protein [Poseidonocella sp. HB161398]|uniref:BadF/BadG/BcrA/BcrD ATPase family protein n=1 Tax=Poseidonocella sp. HB161398 TaxID=2320855 RepID=UPI001108DC9B|nr:BadF/BadG/BcrA/BcrD ATPase family protein [Poseidonocella sp. HB161398]